MFSGLLTILGAFGGIYYLEKLSKESDNGKGSVKKNFNMSFGRTVESDSEKEFGGIDGDFVKSRYEKTYNDFVNVLVYFNPGEGDDSGFDDRIWNVLNRIDEEFLSGGEVSVDINEDDDTLKFLELLFNQRLVWNRISEVVGMYNRGDLDDDLYKMILDLVVKKEKEFEILLLENKTRREEKAKNLLNGLIVDNIKDGKGTLNLTKEDELFSNEIKDIEVKLASMLDNIKN